MGTFYPTNDYRNYISHAKRTGRVKNLRARRANAVKTINNNHDRLPGNSGDDFHRRYDPERQRYEEEHEANAQQHQRQLRDHEATRQHEIAQAHREFEEAEAMRRQEDLAALEEHRRNGERNQERANRIKPPRKNPNPNSFTNNVRKPRRRK